MLFPVNGYQRYFCVYVDMLTNTYIIFANEQMQRKRSQA